MRLAVPEDEQAQYAKRIEGALLAAGRSYSGPQYVLVVERSTRVQAAFVYWRTPEGVWQFVGASPVAPGRPGAFDHFLSTLGVSRVASGYRLR